MRRLTASLLVATVTAVVAIVAGSTLVGAASVAPVKVPPGSQSCDTIAGRFGVAAGSWREIRFTEPVAQSLSAGAHTKSAYGNTVTVSVAPQGTISFTSAEPIQAVYVNKGHGLSGANAIYRYAPPVQSDSGLGLLPVELSGVDHVVLCWGEQAPPSTTTTAPTTTTTVAPTTTTTVVVPTSVAATTAPETSVAPPEHPPDSTAAPVVRPQVIARPAAPAQLPATGSASPTLVTLGLLALAGGSIALTVTRRRASRDCPAEG